MIFSVDNGHYFYGRLSDEVGNGECLDNKTSSENNSEQEFSIKLKKYVSRWW